MQKDAKVLGEVDRYPRAHTSLFVVSIRTTSNQERLILVMASHCIRIDPKTLKETKKSTLFLLMAQPFNILF